MDDSSLCGRTRMDPVSYSEDRSSVLSRFEAEAGKVTLETNR